MGKVLEQKSAVKEAAEARKTAMDLHILIGENIDHLNKLVEKRSCGCNGNGNGNGKRKK